MQTIICMLRQALLLRSFSLCKKDPYMSTFIANLTWNNSQKQCLSEKDRKMQLLRVHIPEKNPETAIYTCYYYFDYYVILHLLLLITTYIAFHYLLLPETYFTTCYYYFDYYLSLYLLIPITTYYYLYCIRVSLLLSYYYLLLQVMVTAHYFTLK